MKPSDISSELVNNTILDELITSINSLLSSADIYTDTITAFYVQTAPLVKLKKEREIAIIDEAILKLNELLNEDIATNLKLKEQPSFTKLQREQNSDLNYVIAPNVLTARKTKKSQLKKQRDRLEKSIQGLIAQKNEVLSEIEQIESLDDAVIAEIKKQASEARRLEISVEESDDNDKRVLRELTRKVDEYHLQRKVEHAEIKSLGQRKDNADKDIVSLRKKSLRDLDEIIGQLEEQKSIQEKTSKSSQEAHAKALELRNKFTHQYPSDALIFHRLNHYRSGIGSLGGATSIFTSALMNYFLDFQDEATFSSGPLKQEDIVLTNLLYELYCDANNACSKMRAICDSSAGKNKSHRHSPLRQQLTRSQTSNRDFVDKEAVAKRIQLYLDYLQGNEDGVVGVISLLNQVITFLQGYLKKKWEFKENSYSQTSDTMERKPTKKDSLSFFSRATSDKWIEAKLAPFIDFLKKLEMHRQLMQELTVEDVQTYIQTEPNVKARRFSGQESEAEQLSVLAFRRGSGSDVRATSTSSLQRDNLNEGPK